MSGPKIRLVIILIVILLALFQFLYDPISSAGHALTVSCIRDRFSMARAKWDLAAIRDYGFEIQGESQSICTVNARIEVRNNTVTEVMPLGVASPLPSEKWADPDWGNEVFLCNYNHFTIPRIFDMVGRTLQNAPSSILEIAFDPHYGFITDFRDGPFVGHGWLGPQISNVYNEFQIRNFQQR